MTKTRQILNKNKEVKSKNTKKFSAKSVKILLLCYKIEVFSGLAVVPKKTVTESGIKL